MDRPTEGTVRAVLPKPEFYEDEDWDMCIEAVLGNPPFNRETTIPRAALWARDFLGLEFEELGPGNIVWDNLESALHRALNSSESTPAALLVDCQAL